MNKTLLWAVAVISLGAVTTNAGEPASANISNSNLSALGLGGMTIISDDEGANVRGMGFSITSGNGYAFGLFSPAVFNTNNYNSAGLFMSGGNNSSRAGVDIPVGLGGGLGFSLFGLTTGIGGGIGGSFGLGHFGGGASGSMGF